MLTVPSSVDDRDYLRGGKKVFLVINPGEEFTKT